MLKWKFQRRQEVQLRKKWLASSLTQLLEKSHISNHIQVLEKQKIHMVWYAYMVYSDTNIHMKVVILTSSAVKSGFSRAFDIFPDVSFPSKIFHFEPLVWGSSKPLLGDFVNAESATRSPRSMESLVILPVSDKFSNSAWAVWCFSISSRRTPLTGLWTLRLGS